MKYFRIGFIVCLFLPALKAWALDGSFVLQAGYAQVLPSSGQNLAATYGLNTDLYFDINLSPSFALGLSTAFTDLESGPSRLYVDGTLLNFRWSPWAASSWSPYLTAGAGFRPLSELDSDHRWWPGNFQSQAGIGIRHAIFQGMDLDVTAFYNINTSTDSPLSTAGLRAGFAFPINFSAPIHAASPQSNAGQGSLSASSHHVRSVHE